MPKDPNILFHTKNENDDHTGYFTLTKALMSRLNLIRDKGFTHLPNGAFVTLPIAVTFIEWHHSFSFIVRDKPKPIALEKGQIDPHKNPTSGCCSFLNVHRNGFVVLDLFISQRGLTEHHSSEIGSVAALDKLFRTS